MARKTRNQRRGSTRTATSGSPLLSTYRPLIDQALFALAIIGVIVTVHLWIQQGRGFDQGCWGFNPPAAGETSVFDCEAVVTSDAGKMFGISNVYWGMVFYALLSLVGFLVGRARATEVQKFKQIRAGLVGLGFLYSVYLVNVQVNGIGEYCALCLTSAAIMTIMFLITLYDVFTSKQAAEGEQPALPIATNFYKILPGVAVLLIAADLLYFNNLELNSTPAATASAAVATGGGESTCTVNPNMGPFPQYESFLSSFDPTVGPEDASVTVVEFFDPNCPHCQAAHPVMKEVIAKYQDRVRFHLVPYPLGEYSLAQIEAMYVAKEQNKFFEMLDAQMAMQETRGLSPDRVRELAGLIGMDEAMLNARWRSGLYRDRILQQRQVVSQAGVNTVPTVIVNGQVVYQKTVDCISEFIDKAAS